MDRWIGKVAIVTGGSSGIGAAIATKLVEEGAKVVAVARRKDRLENLANILSDKKGILYPFVADITISDEIMKIFAWTKEHVELVHILVNNAGVCYRSKLSESKIEEAKATIDLNIIALMSATRETLRIFQENNIQGHIININSVTGHRILPEHKTLAVYSSSKHAVTALTKSTYLEIQNMKLGAKVTSISPGFVETEIIDEQVWDFLKQNTEFSFMKPKDIADAIIYVLSTPPNCQIDELTIRPIFVPK